MTESIITPERVLEAYNSTKLKPIAGLWTHKHKEQNCACGLTAIMVNESDREYEDIAKELEDDNVDNTSVMADYLKLPIHYVSGFINGFDGNDQTNLYVDDQGNFDKGYADGEKAWDALTQAGIISVDEAADLREAKIVSKETVILPSYLTERDGLLYVRTHDEHYIHQSFELPSGQILVFESLPGNHPQNALCTFKTFDEYIESIKTVPWINDDDYIIRSNEKMSESGFPFTE